MTDTWRTKDGEKIPMSELEDSHLLNIAKATIRFAAVRAIDNEILDCMYSNLPDDDEFKFGNEFPSHYHYLVMNPFYPIVNKELKRRNFDKSDYGILRYWIFEPFGSQEAKDEGA